MQIKTMMYHLTPVRMDIKKFTSRNFPGGLVVKNLPSNAGDVSSIPGQGTKIPHAVGQLSPCTLEPACHDWRVHVLQLLSLHALEPTQHN